MRRFSVLFISLAIISLSTRSLHAQREIGAESLSLDDGAGHVVDIKLPSGLTGGPYTWTLPITPGGASLTLPTPTIAGSMLYSNGTNAWLENKNVTATNLGVLSVAGAYQIAGSTVLSDAGTNNIFVGAGAGGSGSGNTVVGSSAVANAVGATALGFNAQATSDQSVAVGADTHVSAVGAIGIGLSATATANDATAIGNDAFANSANATAIGNGASATATNEIQLGNTSVTLVNTSGAITAGGNVTTTGSLTTGTTGQFTVDNSGNVTTSGSVRAGTGVNLSGTVSPLQLNGSAGTSAQVLTSAGPGNTPTWASYAATSRMYPTDYSTTSTSPVMAGLSSGTTVITPTKSGKVLITMMGNLMQSTAGGGAIYLAYGSGNGPSAGSAATGMGETLPVYFINYAAVTAYAPATLTAVVTGLTVGTGYWIDAVISSNLSSNTFTFYNITTTAVELP